MRGSGRATRGGVRQEEGKRKRAKGRGRDPHKTIDEILLTTQPRKTGQEQGCGGLNESATF